MAKVQAIPLRPTDKYAGYYNHRRLKAGDTFEMKEVDEEGYYLEFEKVKGKDGEEKEVVKLDKDKKPVRKLKDGKPIKCRWVGPVGSYAEKKVDPKAVAAVLSGKNPGVGNPLKQE